MVWVGWVYDLHFIVIALVNIDYYVYNCKNEIHSGGGGGVTLFLWAYTNLNSTYYLN